MDAIDTRIALNETLFRDVNNNIQKTSADGRHDEAHFVCECGESNCEERVSLPLETYKKVRAVSTHFFVKPGHEIPRAEMVIERHPTFLVVQKPPEAEPVLDQAPS